MFVQEIRGQVSDPAAARAAFDRWLVDLAPGASGWLGSTAGVSDDGRLVALARFESEDAARRNSDRPEQGEWWAGTAKLFTGEVTFDNSSDVTVDTVGDPDTAGFVQVMRGRGSDPARARELMGQDSAEWAAFRPDILGTVAVGREGGAYTVAIYFTSEAAAREGEGKQPPPRLQAQMAEMQQLNVGPPEFLDLTDPWLSAPGRAG
jgi:hypothetical protein